MKNFSKLVLAILITFNYANVYSQDENIPWQFSFGINAIDLNADEFFEIKF